MALIRMTAAMCRKETATMLPEQRPDLFPIRYRQGQLRKILPLKKSKLAFPMIWRRILQSSLYLKQEHQPMRLTFVSVFADDPRQVKVAWLQLQSHLLLPFPAGATVRRFTNLRVQFPSARTPQTQVRL